MVLLGARFSLPVQTGPEAHPTSCTMGAGSFPGVKLSERGVNHPPPFRAKVKERVELYFLLPFSTFMACSRVTFTFYIICPCLPTPEHHSFLLRTVTFTLSIRLCVVSSVISHT